jgi:DNA-binding GntR family transcriptional regulator
MPKKENEGRAADLSYEVIKSNILSQRYPAGFQLREVPLSEELGFTRTPVREAIIRLESEGLVVSFPNRGAFVASLSAGEIEDLFDVREALETKATELVIRKANREQLANLQAGLEKHGKLLENADGADYRPPALDFHEALIKLSQNKHLIDIWQGMRSKLRLARITSAALAQRYLEAHIEHEKILDLICTGKNEEVRKLMIAHIGRARHNVLETINRQSN